MERNQSEVAALKARLETECEGYRFFVQGFALTASHSAITRRMQAFGVALREIKNELLAHVGEEEASRIIGQTFQEKVTE
jgi:hypothetical protein